MTEKEFDHVEMFCRLCTCLTTLYVLVEVQRLSPVAVRQVCGSIRETLPKLDPKLTSMFLKRDPRTKDMSLDKWIGMVEEYIAKLEYAMDNVPPIPEEPGVPPPTGTIPPGAIH